MLCTLARFFFFCKSNDFPVEKCGILATMGCTMKRLVWGILICSFVLFSLAPTFYELSQKEKLHGRMFEPVHNYVTDYNFYLSRIREGMEGRWTVAERYTSEEHRGSFIQIFYLMLGKPVAFFPNTLEGATVAYHAARIFLGLLLLALIARLAIRTFRTFLWQILAFLIIVTASTIPIVVSMPDGLRFGGYMSWWTVMDSLQRITFLPHLLFGQAMIVFLIFDVFDTGKRSCTSWLFGKFIAAFLLGLVFPPGFMFVGAVYAVQSVLEVLSDLGPFVRSSRQRTDWMSRTLLPRIAILSGGIPATLYYLLMVKLVPWRRLIEFDVLNPTWFPLPDYWKAVGPVLVLGIIGAIIALFKKAKDMAVFVSWIIAWLLLLFVFRFIPEQSSLRFTEVAPHIPLGILTTYLFFTIIRYISSKKAHASLFHCSIVTLLNGRLPNNGTIQQCNNWVKSTVLIGLYVLTFAPIAVGLGIMYCSFLWQKDYVNQKVAAGWPAVAMKNVMVYPVTGFVDALSFIEKETPEDAVILSDLTAGNYIPAYAGRTVFVGHDNTMDKEKKLSDVQLFYTGTMKAPQARAWLFQNRITYVFWGPQEKESQKDLPSLYPFLQEAYKNSDVTMYRVAPVPGQ